MRWETHETRDNIVLPFRSQQPIKDSLMGYCLVDSGPNHQTWKLVTARKTGEGGETGGRWNKGDTSDASKL